MEPITRSEQYLASIIGEEVELPVPQSRIEHYLNIIAQNGVAPSSAGLINYDPDAAYPDGSIGKEVHTLDGDVSDLKSEIDDLGDTYAKQDGSYDTLTVGQAKQLVATVGVEDKVPYLFRTTGGSADVGDRKTMEIVGGTIAWNQKMTNGNFASTNYWQIYNGTFSVSDGIATVVPASDSTFSRLVQATPTIKGHKYLWGASFNGPSTIGNIRLSWFGALPKDVPFSGNWQRVEYIVDNVYDPSSAWQLYFGTAYNVLSTESYQIKDAVCFDLTQMFGSTIADYIYTLETANAGAGVAWFRKLFPKPYYANNAGTLMSVKTSANVTTGFNQFDKTASYLSSPYRYVDTLIGENHELYMTLKDKDTSVSVSDIYLGFTDTNEANAATRSYNWVLQNGVVQESHSNKATIGTYNKLCKYVFIFPASDDAWSRINRRYDICVNIKWDGERDGEYEPYITHEYALDSDLELRGIPKLDADNALYYDGDTYEADGTVTRKYGIIDLGTVTWNKDSNNTFYCSLPSNCKGVIGSVVANAICSKYVTTTNNNIQNYLPDKTLAVTTGYVRVYDSVYASATYTEFKTAMSGVYFVYEFATPDPETADPYQTPQIVNDFGTEEFVDTRDVPIPVGHDTMYQANLRAKLEMAPDSPSGNGDYIVRHSNGQNAYVPITFPADELPAAPTEDGSYVLKVTVASGEATYTWEVET